MTKKKKKKQRSFFDARDKLTIIKCLQFIICVMQPNIFTYPAICSSFSLSNSNDYIICDKHLSLHEEEEKKRSEKLKVSKVFIMINFYVN